VPLVAVTLTTNPSGRHSLSRLVEFILLLTSEIVSVPENFDWRLRLESALIRLCLVSIRI
jgi:hypothetical protein